jgi:hypothetical protein
VGSRVETVSGWLEADAGAEADVQAVTATMEAATTPAAARNDRGFHDLAFTLALLGELGTGLDSCLRAA